MDGDKPQGKYKMQFEIKALVTVNINATSLANAMLIAKRFKLPNFLNRQIVTEIKRGSVKIMDTGNNG